MEMCNLHEKIVNKISCYYISKLQKITKLFEHSVRKYALVYENLSNNRIQTKLKDFVGSAVHIAYKN